MKEDTQLSIPSIKTEPKTKTSEAPLTRIDNEALAIFEGGLPAIKSLLSDFYILSQDNLKLTYEVAIWVDRWKNLQNKINTLIQKYQKNGAA